MHNLYKVVNQTQPIAITKQDGTQSQKATIVLQKLGGKYEDSFAAVLLGNLASLKIVPGSIVIAALRFTSREYNNQYYQDVTVQEIYPLASDNKENEPF